MKDIKTIIEEIYQDQNPDKISDVPKLVEKYKGKDTELLLRISKKYNIRLENYITFDYLRFIKVILMKHDPLKVTTASTLLISNHGKEKELLKILSEKYNTDFNELIIDNYLNGSQKIQEPIVADDSTYVSQKSISTINERPPSKSQGKLMIGIICSTIVITIVVLLISGIFKSGKKGKMEDSEIASQQSNAVVIGSSEKSNNIDNKNANNSTKNTPNEKTDDAIKTRANATIQAYYSDLMNKTFDATKYFSDKIDRFISIKNTNPNAINSYINSSYYKEFANARSEIERDSFTINKEPGNEYSVEYIENGSCYRTSLKKYQHAIVNVRVMLNDEFKIISFHQYKIIENDYSDSPPSQLTVNSTAKSTDNTETQNKGGSFYIISAAAVKTEAQAKSKASELRINGNSTGYLWIPDYASLSGARFYCVYIGPFSSQQDCEVATENYRRLYPEAYGLLVSQDKKRVQINGIGKVVETQKQSK